MFYMLRVPLTRKQWFALVLLFFACCLEQLGSFNMESGARARAS